MTCRKIQALLENYIDGELTEEQIGTVKEHIENCSDCRNEHNDLILLKELLAAQKTSPANEEYWDETQRLIMARTVDAEKESAEIYSLDRDESKKRDAFFKSIISVAASLFILIVSVLLGSGINETSFTKEFSVDKPVFSVVPKEKKNPSYEYVTEDSRIKQLGSRIILGAPGLLGRSAVFDEIKNSQGE